MRRKLTHDNYSPTSQTELHRFVTHLNELILGIVVRVNLETEPGAGDHVHSVRTAITTHINTAAFLIIPISLFVKVRSNEIYSITHVMINACGRVCMVTAVLARYMLY